MQVMVREGKKFRASGGGKRYSNINEEKAEEKGPDRRASQSKYEVSDYEDDGYKEETKQRK